MEKIESSCIIDDDPIAIYGIKKSMKEIDFCNTILVYQNGQDAIDGLNNMVTECIALPSIILLDLNMPIMDGWEFLDDFIKMPNSSTKEVTIYIISSSIDPRDVIKAKDYSLVSNYILKPIKSADLLKLITNRSNA
ncbi:response regulator [Arenibacter sp. M-2]|uniref:response regulator n=1 Tax=unclassified Arenibacter TaxID=2615047 RepID=UPI000D7740C8|nr:MULTISPECIES: response regulator [unclassified Arenibacter]MDL5512971.1 response regulator [Arenibacter sp. M-2]PXX31482.1 response regulator receiver domain-containing protein [Arenibacter sp. ARW7G5Y1]|tara:strand:- start:8751 stop:9158 length:408 start_codon:yes stop_codon:yes gene_type:complete